MNPREAFRVFIRFQLKSMQENGYDFSDQEVEEYANEFEDDDSFYNKLSYFLADYIEDYYLS